MGRWTGKTTVRDTNKEFSGKYKVDRIFADKHGECTARREMINYLREGDEVIVEDIYDICDSVRELIDLLVQFHIKGVHFCIYLIISIPR